MEKFQVFLWNVWCYSFGDASNFTAFVGVRFSPRTFQPITHCFTNTSMETHSKYPQKTYALNLNWWILRDIFKLDSISELTILFSDGDTAFWNYRQSFTFSKMYHLLTIFEIAYKISQIVTSRYFWVICGNYTQTSDQNILHVGGNSYSYKNY